MVCFWIVLVLCQVALTSWASLIKMPDEKAMFEGIYDSLDLQLPLIRGGKKERSSGCNRKFHVTHITNYLRQTTTQGVADTRLKNLIVDDLMALLSLGKLQLEEAWRVYMAKHLIDSENPSLRRVIAVAKRIQRACKKSIPKDPVLVKGWKSKMIGELAPVTITNEMVELAIDFHQFVMLWKLSTVHDFIARFMALIIFNDEMSIERFGKMFLTEPAETRVDYNYQVYQSFIVQCLEHKKKPQPKTETAFEELIEKIIPNPWQNRLGALQTRFIIAQQLLPCPGASRKDVMMMDFSADHLSRYPTNEAFDLVLNQLSIEKLEESSRTLLKVTQFDIRKRSEQLKDMTDIYKKLYNFYSQGRKLGGAYGFYTIIQECFSQIKPISEEIGMLLAGYVGELELRLRTQPVDPRMPMPNLWSSSWDKSQIGFLLGEIFSVNSEHTFNSLGVWLQKQFETLDLNASLGIMWTQLNLEILTHVRIFDRTKKSNLSKQTPRVEVEEDLEEAYQNYRNYKTRMSQISMTPEEEKQLKQRTRHHLYQLHLDKHLNEISFKDSPENWENIKRSVANASRFLGTTAALKLRALLEKRLDEYRNWRLAHWIYYAMTRLPNKLLLKTLRKVEEQKKEIPGKLGGRSEAIAPMVVVERDSSKMDGASKQLEELEKALKSFASSKTDKSYYTWIKIVEPILLTMNYEVMLTWSDVFKDHVRPILRHHLGSYLDGQRGRKKGKKGPHSKDSQDKGTPSRDTVYDQLIEREIKNLSEKLRKGELWDGKKGDTVGSLIHPRSEAESHAGLI